MPNTVLLMLGVLIVDVSDRLLAYCITENNFLSSLLFLRTWKWWWFLWSAGSDRICKASPLVESCVWPQFGTNCRKIFRGHTDCDGRSDWLVRERRFHNCARPSTVLRSFSRLYEADTFIFSNRVSFIVDQNYACVSNFLTHCSDSSS